MKKILLLMAICFCASGVWAQEQTTMPSDEEILQTIRQYNFDKSKEEIIFKKTKQQLENYYKSGAQNVPSVYDDTPENIIPEPGVKEPKKYTSHDPLTRRSKKNK